MVATFTIPINGWLWHCFNHIISRHTPKNNNMLHCFFQMVVSCYIPIPDAPWCWNIYIPTFTPKVAQFCRYIFQHHRASGHCLVPPGLFQPRPTAILRASLRYLVTLSAGALEDSGSYIWLRYVKGKQWIFWNETCICWWFDVCWYMKHVYVDYVDICHEEGYIWRQPITMGNHGIFPWKIPGGSGSPVATHLLTHPQPPLVISYSSNPQEKIKYEEVKCMFSYYHYYHYHYHWLVASNMFYFPFHVWELRSSFYYHY